MWTPSPSVKSGPGVSLTLLRTKYCRGSEECLAVRIYWTVLSLNKVYCYYYIYLMVCVHVRTHMPKACMWRSEDNLGNQFSSSTLWVPGTKFRSIRLGSKHLYRLSHPTPLAWSPSFPEASRQHDLSLASENFAFGYKGAHVKSDHSHCG